MYFFQQKQFNSQRTLTGCLTNLTQFFDSIRSHSLRVQSQQDLPTSDARLKSRLLPVLWPAAYQLEVPMTPSLGLINLLERFTELRKTLTYIYQFIIKDIVKNRKNSQMKRYIEWGPEGSRAQEFLPPWKWDAPPSQDLDAFTNLMNDGRYSYLRNSKSFKEFCARIQIKDLIQFLLHLSLIVKYNRHRKPHETNS